MTDGVLLKELEKVSLPPRHTHIDSSFLNTYMFHAICEFLCNFNISLRKLDIAKLQAIFDIAPQLLHILEFVQETRAKGRGENSW